MVFHNSYLQNTIFSDIIQHFRIYTVPWQVGYCYGLSTFDSMTAKIQAKGNNIVEATLKIVKNGSYSFCMEGGTSLYVNVETTPCPTCHPTPPLSEMNPHKPAAKPDDVSVDSIYY